tara:strand:+ start:826 stop:1356 length:531 start_codon:yes stop_codon:yes gene_type:complete
MKYIVLIISLILIFSQSVDASCKNSQIDINTATIEDLDKLYGIGIVKAQAIIDSRSFNSVDDLIKVKGIGEITLNKIKDQKLACVYDEENIDEETDKKDEEPIMINDTETNSFIEIKSNDFVEASVIKLIPKDIKTEENNENNSNRNYALYGFVVFCILLVFLFVLRKNKFKNEFN